MKPASILLLNFLVLGLSHRLQSADVTPSGSLWNNNGREAQSMFSDRKANRVGDILTITILENTQATASQSTSTQRDAALNDQIAKFLYSPAVSGRLTSGGELPGMQWGGSNEYSGGGQISNRQNLNSRAAVLVTDVLPNGNLVIEGVRKVIFANENSYVYIRGLVRADDIRGDNTVLSSNIAEAHVEFISEGSISDSQRKGWLTRIYDAVNPF